MNKVACGLQRCAFEATFPGFLAHFHPCVYQLTVYNSYNLLVCDSGSGGSGGGDDAMQENHRPWIAQISHCKDSYRLLYSFPALQLLVNSIHLM